MEGGTLSKHGRDQLQQLYSHELQDILKLLSNTCCNKTKFSKRQNARQVVLCNDGIHRWQRPIFFQFKIYFSFPRYFVVRTYALNFTLMQTSEIKINTFLRGGGDSEGRHRSPKIYLCIFPRKYDRGNVFPEVGWVGVHSFDACSDILESASSEPSKCNVTIKFSPRVSLRLILKYSFNAYLSYP